MNIANQFLPLWRQLEENEIQPTRMNTIQDIEFCELKTKVLEQDPRFVKQLVRSLWSGDAYLVKRAFPKDWVEDVKAGVNRYFHETPPSFHKMTELCPDFHRAIDAETTKLYAVDAIKHTSYFFPWNQDPLNLFQPVWERWGVYKFLGGFAFNEYTKNTPKDGVVDRIQVCVYPSGAGGLGTHSDPFLNQRVFISGYLSKRGEDYHTGGFYVIGQNNEKVDLEDRIEVGDMGFGYATVLHGVNPIDPEKKPNWENSKQGRWFLGLYSNDSDEKGANRHTAYRVNELAVAE